MKFLMGFRILVMLLLILTAAPVQAAVITVDDSTNATAVNGLCSINEAIDNANVEEGDIVHTDCTEGEPGADTILLTRDVTLVPGTFTFVDGINGTESITSEIIIDGNDFSLSRAEDTLRWRR